MHQHIEDLKRQNEAFLEEYKRMEEEKAQLAIAKAKIEEQAKKDKEESMRLLSKQEEEKR